MTDWAVLVGTLAGAVVGGGLTWLTERASWKRQQQSRWDTIKRELFARLLADFESLATAARAYAASVQGMPIDAPFTQEQARLRGSFDSALEQLALSIAEVEMITSDQLQRALGDVRRSASATAIIAHEGTDPAGDDGKWDSALMSHGRARSAFIGAAQRELGGSQSREK